MTDSSDTILIKADKVTVPSNLKENLFSKGKKIKKLSREIRLKSLTLAYDIITETFVMELNKTRQ